MGSTALVGVDTHKDRHSAAVVDTVGAVIATTDVTADASGYCELLRWGRRYSAQRTWVVEGTGSYGAGLTTFLVGNGEAVLEGDRPQRRKPGPSGKSDALDAVRVAREALGREHHALPRQRGRREAIRVLLTARKGAVDAYVQGYNQLSALVVTAPEPIRRRLRALKGASLVKACLRLRSSGDLEAMVTITTMRQVGRRLSGLRAETADYEAQLQDLIADVAPNLLAEAGVGPVAAAQLLVSWSHVGRVRNENAFAVLAGVAPIPASSGRVVRHRLSRFGDRQLNRTLHMVALSRAHYHAETKRYIARRTAEGKSPREIRRCIKRYLARRFFRLLQGLDKS